jgi:hypothetical protein
MEWRVERRGYLRAVSGLGLVFLRICVYNTPIAEREKR